MDVEDVTYPDVVNDEKAVELTQYQREDYGSTFTLHFYIIFYAHN